MRLTADDLREMEDDLAGYCTNCKEITNYGAVEPDARNYECELCETNTVQGCMTIMGL